MLEIVTYKFGTNERMVHARFNPDASLFVELWKRDNPFTAHRDSFAIETVEGRAYKQAPIDCRCHHAS